MQVQAATSQTRSTGESARRGTCGASAAMCWAARSTTTGPIRGRCVHEHWADSDRLNLANGSDLIAAEEALRSQWGERPPEKLHQSREHMISFPSPLWGGVGWGREVKR